MVKSFGVATAITCICISFDASAVEPSRGTSNCTRESSADHPSVCEGNPAKSASAITGTIGDFRNTSQAVQIFEEAADLVKLTDEAMDLPQKVIGVPQSDLAEVVAGLGKNRSLVEQGLIVQGSEALASSKLGASALEHAGAAATRVNSAVNKLADNIPASVIKGSGRAVDIAAPGVELASHANEWLDCKSDPDMATDLDQSLCTKILARRGIKTALETSTELALPLGSVASLGVSAVEVAVEAADYLSGGQISDSVASAHVAIDEYMVEIFSPEKAPGTPEFEQAILERRKLLLAERNATAKAAADRSLQAPAFNQPSPVVQEAGGQSFKGPSSGPKHRPNQEICGRLGTCSR